MDDGAQNPLLSKQAIIVLREELEYFSITPASPRLKVTNGVANEDLRALKRACGRALAERRMIFTALQRNVNKENNMAEQHLIDMLCMRRVAQENHRVKADGIAGLVGTTCGDSERVSQQEISSRPWRSSSSRRVSYTPGPPKHHQAR